MGPLAFVGYRAVPWGAWVLALWSLLVLSVLIHHSLFINLQNNFQQLKFARKFCYYLFPELETILLSFAIILSPELETISQ